MGAAAIMWRISHARPVVGQRGGPGTLKEGDKVKQRARPPRTDRAR